MFKEISKMGQRYDAVTSRSGSPIVNLVLMPTWSLGRRFSRHGIEILRSLVSGVFVY